MLLEVDPLERGRAVRARLAQAVVDAVRLLVGDAGQAKLEAVGEELADRRGQAFELLVREVGRERVR